MKRILILFITLLVTLSTLAQTNSRVKEAGVAFSGLDRFGFTYRFGTERALWRVNLVSVAYTANDRNWPEYVHDDNSRNYGIDFGREFRREIAPNLAFRYGADLSFTYGKFAGNTQSGMGESLSYSIHYTAERYTPGLQLVLGLCYTLNKVVIGAELHPFLHYDIITSDVQRNLATSFHLNQSTLNYRMFDNSVELSVAYRL